MSQLVKVANTIEVPSGEGRSFEVNDRIIAVFNVDGQFYAIDDMCPHMGASLSAGYFDSQTCVVSCPLHAWRFDVRDGTWCDNPRVATDHFEVQVINEEIFVKLAFEDNEQQLANDG